MMWTIQCVPNEGWQRSISIRKCTVLKETVVEEWRAHFLQGNAILTVLWWFCVDLFSGRHMMQSYPCTWRDGGRKGCVLTKYELTGVRNQNAEITGVKHGSFINLIFHGRLVIHFDHQNSGLYSFTKCNSLKSIICFFKSSHYLENHTGVW